jgi:hypothetical protein
VHFQNGNNTGSGVIEMMAALSQERRDQPKDLNYFWHELNMAQKFSVAELQRFGYELAFVRRSPSFSMAVLRAGDRIAAVDQDGQIDTEPKVIIRH